MGLALSQSRIRGGLSLLLLQSAETLVLEVANGETQEVAALLDGHDLSLFPVQF